MGPEALLDIALLVGTLLAILMLFRADVTIIIIESMGFVSTVLRKGKPIGHVQQSPHAALAFWTLLGIAPTALQWVIISLFFQDLALKMTMGMLRSGNCITSLHIVS
jgi:hypothetical protein